MAERPSSSDEVSPGALSPYQLEHVALANRVFVSAHTTGLGSPIDGIPGDLHLDYYAERARGGIGLIFTDRIRVHPLSVFGRRIPGHRDEVVPALSRISRALHDLGCAFFAQLFEPGRHLSGSDGSWSASPLRGSRALPCLM